jgi:hypothetical protein
MTTCALCDISMVDPNTPPGHCSVNPKPGLCRSCDMRLNQAFYRALDKAELVGSKHYAYELFVANLKETK